MAQLAREEHEVATPVVENGSGIGRRGVAILAAWTLVAMLFAGQAWFAAQVRGEPLAWARASVIWLVWAAVWAALTPVALRLAARFPLQRPRVPARARGPRRRFGDLRPGQPGALRAGGAE